MQFWAQTVETEARRSISIVKKPDNRVHRLTDSNISHMKSSYSYAKGVYRVYSPVLVV